MMVITTVTVAVARLVVFLKINIIKVFSIGDDDYMYGDIILKIPLALLLDLEPYIGAIVSCFPGIRAWIRSRRGRQDECGEDCDGGSEGRECVEESSLIYTKDQFSISEEVAIDEPKTV